MPAISAAVPRTMAATFGGIFVLAAWSCGGDAAFDGGQSHAAVGPEHPAMTAPVAKTAAVTKNGHGPRAGGSALPPGHPPIGGGGERAPEHDHDHDHEEQSESGPEEIPVDGPLEFSGVQFDVPSGWVREKPEGRMRLAQFRLPRAEGDERDGSVTVIVAAGSIDSNVSRWQGQFQNQPKAVVEPVTVGGLDVVDVTIEGTFVEKTRPMAPGPGTPRDGSVLRAAIVEASGGKLFFKGVGPKATMERWGDSFRELIQSFRN